MPSSELLADVLAEPLPALHPARARLMPRTAATAPRYRDFRFRVWNMLDPRLSASTAAATSPPEPSGSQLSLCQKSRTSAGGPRTTTVNGGEP
jgi:hypothetical protein